MKKLSIKISFFLLGLIILIFFFGQFDNIDKFRNTNPNVARITNATRFDSLDILFIGSSASYSGINPVFFDSLGLRTYNLGIAAAGPYFYELLVNDYLAAVKQKPKSVFLLMLPTTFMDQIDNFEEIGIHRYLNKPISNETIAKKYSSWSSYPNLLIKSFQKGAKNLIFRDKLSEENALTEINGKGFYPSKETSSSTKELQEFSFYSGWIKQKFHFNKFEYLIHYAKSLEEQGIVVVFYFVPSNKASSFINKQFLKDFSNVLSTTRKTSLILDGTPINLIDSLDYRNSDHLNSNGASKVSKTIANEIVNTPKLKYLFGLSDTYSQLNK